MILLCPNCGFENPEEMKFCEACATPLGNSCSNCGFENPPGFKFCGECGTPLHIQASTSKSGQESHQTDAQTAQDTQTRSPSTARRPPAAERRHLTVMFCDLVGSTALSVQLDPEVLREVVRQYQESCAEAVNRYDGYIAQYLGDGLLIYFGYPRAHEDDAHRAVRAGLGIMEEMDRLNARLRSSVGVQLAVRVGIHTGLVVVGEMGGGPKHELLALGETPNIAARLQNLAEPNTLVISGATFRLIRGYFLCEDLGTHYTKGISQPIESYRVLQESGARTRLEVALATGLTPLVGKEKEIELLMDLWHKVEQGVGQAAPGEVVMLSGEAGIGKSRLLQVFKERMSEKPHTWLECRCSPYHQNSSLYPVIELFQRLLELRREDPPEEKLGKLERMLGQCEFCLPEAVALFADLLSVPLSERYPPLNLFPQRQKQKTLEALLAMLEKMAAQQPIVFVMEDLHWADPSTLELLGLPIAKQPITGTLFLFTFRPEFTPSWVTHPEITFITLGRLTHKQTEVMVEQVTGGKVLPAQVLEQIVNKTDGVPLFVEELTKMVVESDLLREHEGGYDLPQPLPPLAIPETLHDSLMARLDRLAAVKEVIQLGATLGREFTYEVLRAVSPLNEATLQWELARLVDAQLLYLQRDSGNSTTYVFKHALIQDAAYQSLLKSKRQEYHRQIAKVLVEQFQETRPEILAHHYAEAEQHEPAAFYCYWAGQQAMERSALLEGIRHFTKGVELLQGLPSTPERTQLELDLQTSLGSALMVTKGYGAPEVDQTFTRALELCQQLDDTHQLFPALRSQWGFYNVRAKYQAARKLGEQLLKLAQREQDPAFIIDAHRALGNTLFWLGDFASALAQLEQGISLYDPKQHRSLAFLFGQDPVVICRCFAALAQWQLGYPDQALELSNEAVKLAEALSHP
jgi:class 3 adenylate cyclase/tetratricopeptide (TPR) repeat protein